MNLNFLSSFAWDLALYTKYTSLSIDDHESTARCVLIKLK